jgi:uncharacterized protein YutE (UPF0331/DUF86 family)
VPIAVLNRSSIRGEVNRSDCPKNARLAEARERVLAGGSLSRLEQNGVLHALQVLVENAIGKAKHLIKAAGEPVPVSPRVLWDETWDAAG